jgi:hypothetical protein
MFTIIIHVLVILVSLLVDHVFFKLINTLLADGYCAV